MIMMKWWWLFWYWWRWRWWWWRWWWRRWRGSRWAHRCWLPIIHYGRTRDLAPGPIFRIADISPNYEDAMIWMVRRRWWRYFCQLVGNVLNLQLIFLSIGFHFSWVFRSKRTSWNTSVRPQDKSEHIWRSKRCLLSYRAMTRPDQSFQFTLADHSRTCILDITSLLILLN